MNGTIYYLCPDDDAPTGGIRVIYQHVDALNAAGIPAAVLHATPGFRCTWFEHDTRIAHHAPGPDDVVAIPEIYGPDLATLFPGVRKVTFNQGGYSIFNGYGHDGWTTTAYHHPEVVASLAISDDTADYVRHAFPHLPVHRVRTRIDTELFKPAGLRRRRIAFMPRRNAQDAVQVLSILRARGALEGVEVLPLHGLGEAEVAAALAESLIFLSLGTQEGCPMPPKEAMASGCLTIGYDGRGGREFMRPDVAYPIEPGDVISFAQTVERVLAEHPGDPSPLSGRGRAAAELIREHYSEQRQRESVVAAWSAVLGLERRPLASIAILTLNGLAHTRACLESIERSTPEPHELVLVDNGSTDGTVEFLRDWVARHDNAKLVVNAENRGFAGGNNQALALAEGEHLVLLNNDTVVADGWLSRLVDAAAGGLSGPVSNYVVGRQLVPIDYTTLEEVPAWAARWAGAHMGRREPAARLVGFCLLFSRAVLDAVGGLDETFGAGNFEDDDYCLRARLAGFPLTIARDAFVHHTGSQTFLGQKIDYVAAMRRNQGVFEAKWGVPFEQALAAPPHRPELVHLPLPAAPALDDGSAAEEHGELRVERLLQRTRDALLADDLETLRASFAAPHGWTDEPHRAYQAVRHLAELVLTHGAEIQDDRWLALYEIAAEGLVAWLEREPSEPFLLNVAGVFLYELTEAEAAIALFESALRLDPEVGAEDNLAAARGLTARLHRPAAARIAERALRVAAAARPAEGLRLSLCMIVKDEEELLPGCLAAARGAVDELIVVDTGSTDRTVEIARSYGAQVVEFPWNGSFADARNVSLDAATGDWVMYLDADEHLAADAAPKLRALLGKTWREAFYLVETNYTGAEDAGTAVTHPAMRVFRNRPEYRFEGRIHEQKTRHMPTYLPERFETTDVALTHYGYLHSRVQAKDKSRRNLELLAAEPPSPFASFNLGSEYQLLGEWANAATHFDAAWEQLTREDDWSQVGFAPLLGLRGGRARRECGRLDDARVLLEQAIALWPEYTDLTFELALCARLQGDPAEAERLLERCLALGDAPPRYPATVGAGSFIAAAVLGELAEARGDDDTAERRYREALAAGPLFVAPILPLAGLLLRRGVPAERLAEQLPLDRPRAHVLAATAALEAGSAAAAEALLHGAEPGNAAARAARFEALVAQRRWADVLAEALPADTQIAAQYACLAAAVLGDLAALDRALGTPVDAGDRELYAAWRDALAGAVPAVVPAAALEPALVALEALLRVQEFEAFEALVGVYERIAVPLPERRDRLARLYLSQGFVDSAEDEWRRGEPDAAARIGLAQVAVAREPDSLAARRELELLATGS
jgi:GT2 family glycosyltransferase/glycosyltransferase involved in cell wall biosynthesis